MWMLHIGRSRHPGPGKRIFPPGQLSIEFVNVGGWLTSGDLALDSCAQFLGIADHRLIPSRAVIILFGLLLARIRLLVFMLGLAWLVWVVPPHLLSLLSFRSFSCWVVY